MRSLSRLDRALRSPGTAWQVAIALLRGRWVIVANRLAGRRVRAGRNLKVFGKLRIRGPGEVVFGDDVVIYGTVTPYTYDPEARISIGDRTMMNGTRFGCVREIVIGRDCIIAEARIFDTDFHSTRADRRTNPDAPVRVASVRLGDNVWIGELAAILPGTIIGDNTVVSFGAICMREYPADKIVIGNPAKVASPIVSAEP